MEMEDDASRSVSIPDEYVADSQGSEDGGLQKSIEIKLATLFSVTLLAPATILIHLPTVFSR